MMKERPIIFSTPMVRAILESRKTQTRRVIKPQPSYVCGHDHQEIWHPNEKDLIKCPYGKPGDRLLVRESFAIVNDIKGFPYLVFKEEAVKDDSGERIGYWVKRPAEKKSDLFVKEIFFPGEIKWRSAIYMPRLSSRISLDIINVRVERLNQITEEDAFAEGIDDQGSPAVFSFIGLWNKIHGPGSWDKNPWVWVIEFKSGGTL